MGFLKPKVPVLPPPPPPAPEPPSFEDEERAAEAQAKMEQIMRARKGRRSTILTGPGGLADDEEKIKKKVLLGE
jgi:hypothetical protein